MKKQLAILGSTGSIGTQTLDVVAEYPDLFEVYTLTANNNVELLIEQAKRFNPDSVVIANEAHYPRLKEALKEYPIKVYAGDEAIAQIVEAAPIDIVVTAMVGYAGLRPTIRAIEAHKTIALANKETLVVAGDLIKQLALEYHAPIIPVDSEHSAIFQCLVGEWDNPIDKIILTASGGPFRELTAEQMKHVTKNDALKHPKWNMGHKITIDSATLMNKGFEMIEAKWLFDVDPKDIEIAVHPQSIVHSMVQFKDGTVKAQLGVQDMRLPIRYALSYPARLESPNSKLTLEQYAHLTFERPDLERFPLLRYAFDAVAEGGNMPCIMNAANEIAVAAFLHDAIDYPSIARIVAETMAHIEFIASPRYEDYVHTNQLARDYATTLLQ
ncbi:MULTISPECIES: 1-deoxy-D-xylulose-5-phosphate reductoisomerase [unclassified Barnesiella]|uniref:1-deoxy-D-xylulose-5-phosphate reductoisomerase n=1 Tax=unclassified Barnesiella TaxID=2645177 RepID=UPI000B37632E|nr:MULTISPECIES: 1-deoxy-D-xylulose-5-phosphate reductoisomerase [unclassified Barnesiella]MCR8911495.1 1-deoxy-D-xylulose-5-phosphate reductoisomerase [Barnesiella sp. ET7]OUO99496.1 1-deoxy-D-xylulose-5-phosphate reductoisomerase [Barnesiella sp. An22]